jgi:chromosomal replication initiator protein
LIDGVLQLDFAPDSTATLSAQPGISPTAGAARPLLVGQENRLLAPPVEGLLAAMASGDAIASYNPLVVVGPSGSGKSHLVQGLIRAWTCRRPDDAVAYFTAADFGREARAAHADGRLVAWRKALRGTCLLAIDDVDRLRPRGAAQRELRLAIDALTDAGKTIVITSLHEPTACTHLEPGLRDRLVAGLTIRLKPPGLAARRALLAHAAAARGLALEDAELARLAESECSTTARLLGRLARLTSAAPSHPVDQLGCESRQRGCAAALKQIVAMTARYFGVTQAALTGPSRRKSLVAARNVVVHLARQHTSASYAEIGRALGRRDHTTIMHASRRATAWLAADPAMQHAVDELDRLVAV